MGIRGELFSTRITVEGRTYFFNVKQNRMGDVFLTIVESKPTEAETFDRRSIVIFRNDVHDFLKAFQGALKYMEKPGSAMEQLAFNPAEDSAPAPRLPRAKASPAGDKPQEKKRRVVVKRREAAPGKADDAKDSPAED
jgi:hypothetical protein